MSSKYRPSVVSVRVSFFFILQDCSRNGSCCGNLKISGIINLSVFTPNSRNSTRRATERAKREKERDPRERERERESRESPKEGETIDLIRHNWIALLELA